jgi:predicted HicB family RNase H-like nuclease
VSLNTFLEVCREKGIPPTRDFSGKFNLRMSKELHSKIAIEAASEGKCINQWVVDALSNAVE